MCVCVCTLDASKAFDCVNLFNLLRKRNFCHIVIIL